MLKKNQPVKFTKPVSTMRTVLAAVEHHRGNSGIHGMGTKAWERAYDVSQRDLLALVQERMQ